MTRTAGCRGCGGRFADPADDDSHPYMLASAGCWTAYNGLLAREYQDRALFARCHRLSVDAYAVQHRGDGDPRAERSVWLHFVGLDAMLRGGRTPDAARGAIAAATGRAWPPLPGATPAFTLTHAAVAPASHAADVERWAAAAHAAWAPLLLPLLDDGRAGNFVPAPFVTRPSYRGEA